MAHASTGTESHIPRFLVPHPRERAVLKRYGPRLAERAPDFRQFLFKWLRAEPEMASFLEENTLEAFVAGRLDHYRELLLADYDAERRGILHDLGRETQRLGLPVQWLTVIYAAYKRQIFISISALEPPSDDYAVLRRSVRKRLQLDQFWQEEGFQAAEDERVATREAFFKAVTEANRLFIAALDAPHLPLPEVLSRLSEILVRETGARVGWIGRRSTGDPWLQIEAAAGPASDYANGLCVSVDPGRPEGSGPAGRALQSGRVQIENRLEAPWLAPWRRRAEAFGIGGIAAAPVQTRQGNWGVVTLYRPLGKVFPRDVAELLERLAQDLGAFLDRRADALELVRLRRYHAALEAMQDVLLRHPDPDSVYQRLVGLLIANTDARGAFVAVPEPDSEWLKVVAGAADSEDVADKLMHFKISRDPDNRLYGQRFTAKVFRAGRPLIIEDPRFDPELQRAWGRDPLLRRIKAIGGWPVFREDESQPSAVLVVEGTGTDYFTPALRRLLEQLAASVSIALAEHKIRAKIERLSLRDTLTDLPNRVYFERSTVEAMARAKRDGCQLALGVLDLDGFKEWNDTLGHHAGDRLLQDVAKAFTAVWRTGEGLARLGGDEFGFHVELDDPGELAELSKRLLEAVSTRVDTGGRVTASIGWALYPDDDSDFSALLAHADAALYGAKEAGRNTFKLFRGEIADRVARRFMLHTSFPEALQTGAVEFFLQPQVDSISGTLRAAEMLARWHESSGLRMPNSFIPEVEKSPVLIRSLGRHLLREALAMRAFLASAGQPLHLSVNIGARHFLHPAFLNDVDECLAGAPQRGFTIEITEVAALEDLGRARAVMKNLKARGFRLSLDDFGTGYASLHYAASLPVDELKIDQGFIRHFRANGKSLAVVGTAALLGELTGRLVVAEGIERSVDRDLWVRLGGRRFQGNILTSPLPASEFVAWAKDWKPQPLENATVFPTEDLPLLSYVFADPGRRRENKEAHTYESCPLTHWFQRRERRYSRLGGWKRAQAAHRALHRALDRRRTAGRRNSIAQTRVNLASELQSLYVEIDRMISAEGERQSIGG